jgi:hypothetical protein
LYGDLEQERLLRQQFNQAMLSDLGAAISAAQRMTQTIMSTAPLPYFQEGGYSSGGAAYLHPGEFVLSANTTRAAEDAARTGRLTQDTLTRLFGGSGGMTYNDHRSFDSKVSAEDRRAIQSDTRELLLGLFAA